jgi:hypothetical protein
MSLPFAYIDPGAGSLFFQALVGSVLGGMLIFRNLMSKMGANIKKVASRLSSLFAAQTIDE